MLLIPIVLWWADRPMRFAVGRARIATGGTMILIMLVSAIVSKPLVAEDRYGRESIAPLPGDRANSDRSAAVASGIVLLREGSRIPPTRGRIVLMGRRWVFVVGPSISNPVGGIGDPQASADGAFDPSEVRRLFGSVAFTATPSSGTGDGTTDDVDSNQTAIPANRNTIQLVLSENLNLQRIIEALRADAADENWIITGQISEFFGENRLTILTAQRSNRD